MQFFIREIFGEIIYQNLIYRAFYGGDHVGNLLRGTNMVAANQ